MGVQHTPAWLMIRKKKSIIITKNRDGPRAAFPRGYPLNRLFLHD